MLPRIPTTAGITALLLATACGGEGLVDTELLAGADETASLGAELATSVSVGSVLQATTGVNLRAGPATSHRVLLVIPQGGKVTTVDQATPSNGFYKVKFNGQVGWAHGGYLNLVSSPAPSGPREKAVERARSGVGFSYWWGHGRWRPEGPVASTRGACTGACPSCSHSGSYGADCSGYVAKIWAVGANNSDLTVDAHPYTTYTFANERTHWAPIARSSLRKADALVYNANGSGHIVLFESGDGWGSLWAYECKSCAAGCVRNLRTVTDAYKAIAREGW